MFGIKTILLALGSLALSYGEKILSQGSNSGGRQLKGQKKAKKDSPTYETTDGFHDPRQWVVFTDYAEDTCQTIVACHGYPEGVCARYEDGQNPTDLWWMNYAGESKINMVIMYSFFNDPFCTVPYTSDVGNPYGAPYSPQGVYSWQKGCNKDRKKSFSAQDKPPNFYNGVVFNIFANEPHCKANSVQATFNFNFIPYEQCGTLVYFSTFLKGVVNNDIAPGQVDVGVRLVECHEDYVVIDVHADPACETDHTRVIFPRTDTCKSGQNNGEVLGYGNFKCV